jgi:hypothetical protein
VHVIKRVVARSMPGDVGHCESIDQQSPDVQSRALGPSDQ